MSLASSASEESVTLKQRGGDRSGNAELKGYWQTEKQLPNLNLIEFDKASKWDARWASRCRCQPADNGLRYQVPDVLSVRRIAHC